MKQTVRGQMEIGTEKTAVSGEIEASMRDIVHPSCRLVFQYWHTLRAGQRAPHRDAIDLKQIRAVIPWLAIFEHTARRRTVAWRLAGTGVERMFRKPLEGHEFTGSRLGAGCGAVTDLLAGVIETGTPMIARLGASALSGRQLGIEFMAVPTRAGPFKHTQAFACIAPFHIPAWLDHDPLVDFQLATAGTVDCDPEIPTPADEHENRFEPEIVRQGAVLRVIQGGRLS